MGAFDKQNKQIKGIQSGSHDSEFQKGKELCQRGAAELPSRLNGE